MVREKPLAKRRVPNNDSPGQFGRFPGKVKITQTTREMELELPFKWVHVLRIKHQNFRDNAFADLRNLPNWNNSPNLKTPRNNNVSRLAIENR